MNRLRIIYDLFCMSRFAFRSLRGSESHLRSASLKHRRVAKMTTKIENADMLNEPLTLHETKQMTVGPAITTVTFFRGDRQKATELVTLRVTAIVKANPWLCGTLVKGTGGVLDVRFAKNPSAEDVRSLVNPTRRGGKVGKVPVVDSTMDFFTICANVGGSSAEILKGSSCIGNGEALFACSLVEDAKRPQDTFALVFSGSHVIMDGFTYYKLLAMLCDGAEIIALNPTRKSSIMEQSKRAMGESESSFANGGGVLCNVLGGLICGSKPYIDSFYVDSDRVAALKQNPEGAAYVSTNDVLTSSFGNAVGTDFLLMPLNYREKLPEFTSLDAGNYEGALVFGKGDFSNASSIRRTLNSGPPSFKRGAGRDKVEPLPGCCGACCGKMGMLTSWVFPFFSEVKLEGCEQMLHMPLCDVNMVPFECGVVYRPRAGSLAVVYFVRTINDAGLKGSMPMGGKVGSAEVAFEAASNEVANGNSK